MSGTQVAQLIYAVIAILATFVTVQRLMGGDWMAASWTGLIVAFCVYRLISMQDREE
jgi:hypothetical protein